MTGWRIAGTVMAVWFAANAAFAFALAVKYGNERKPEPELSDRAVDALFDLMVQKTQARDESSGSAS